MDGEKCYLCSHRNETDALNSILEHTRESIHMREIPKYRKTLGQYLHPFGCQTERQVVGNIMFLMLVLTKLFL